VQRLLLPSVKVQKRYTETTIIAVAIIIVLSRIILNKRYASAPL